MDMAPVLTQMGILVFIMAVGFFCTKIGVTGPEFTPLRLQGSTERAAGFHHT